MSDQNGKSKTWEEWQLSALALGELDEVTAARIKVDVESDPSLRAELAAIEQTLDGVRSVFAHEVENEQLAATTDAASAADVPGQSDRFEKVMANVRIREPILPASEPVSTSKSRVELTTYRRWLAVKAMAASVALVALLTLPAVTGWFGESLRLSQTSTAVAPAELVDRPANVISPVEGAMSGDSSSVLMEQEESMDEMYTPSSEEVPAEFGDVPIPPTLPLSQWSSGFGQQNGQSAGADAGDGGAGYGGYGMGAPQANSSSQSSARNSGSASGMGMGGMGMGYGGGQMGGGLGASGQVVGNPAVGNQGESSGMGGYGGGLGYAGDGAVAGGYGGGYGGEGNAGRRSKLSSSAPGVNLSGNGIADSEYSRSDFGDFDGVQANATAPSPDLAAESSDAYGRAGNTAPTSGLALSTLAESESEVVEDQFAQPDPTDELLALNAPSATPARESNEALPLARLHKSELESRRRGGVRREQLRPSDSGRALGDRFEPIYENQFKTVQHRPLSTLSIDVDTASYAKTRQLLLENGTLPPRDAVRIEEFVNYFEYEYTGPKGEDPFGANLAIADCPWRPEHKLVRIALQAEKLDVRDRPKANIVFLLDVSGSMDEPNKLPLVKEAMRMLTEQLGENDKVAMAVYAGAAGCVLEGTRGNDQETIMDAINRLDAGGSTNGAQGIQLAYDLARDNFVPGGINRVILCTDGDFNVGMTSTKSLVDLVAENAKSKIFLTVLGFGVGNLNDAMMEQISNKGNGVYGFVDNRREAYRQMVKQLAGNLVTVAKDVKIQVEFNPNRVAAYRLLGYENRIMAARDFNDDTKDAGEIGAGHRVTALYEIVPTGAGRMAGDPAVDELRYQRSRAGQAEVAPEQDERVGDEWLAVRLRYKRPDEDVSTKLVFPLDQDAVAFSDADRDFRWAASMVQFGMLLRHSRYGGDSSWSKLLENATSAAGVQPHPDRQECLEMIRTASRLSR